METEDPEKKGEPPKEEQPKEEAPKEEAPKEDAPKQESNPTEGKENLGTENIHPGEEEEEDDYGNMMGPKRANFEYPEDYKEKEIKDVDLPNKLCQLY